MSGGQRSLQLQDMERKLDDLVGDSPWSDGFSSSGGSSKGRSLLSTSERAAASPPTQTPSSRNVGSYKGRRGLQKKSGSHHKTHRSMHVDKLIEAQETFGTKNVFDDGMFAGTADPLKSLSKLNFESQTAELHSRFRNVAFGGEWDAEHDTEERLLLAECLIRDGVHGRKIKFCCDVESMKWYLLLHSPWYRFMVTVVICIQLSLALVERPSYRAGPGSETVPETATVAIDLLCALVLCIDMWVTVKATGFRRFCSNKWFPWNAVFVTIMLLDGLISLGGSFYNLSVTGSSQVIYFYRVSRVLRPFFIIFTRRNVGDIFVCALRAVPGVATIIGLVFCCMIFFAGTGFILLRLSDEILPSNINATLGNGSAIPSPFSNATVPATTWDGQCSTYSKTFCNHYFKTASFALYESWLLTMRANWPEIMLPYVSQNPIVPLLYILFLIVTNLLLLRLVTAVSYNNYKTSTRYRFFRRSEYSKTAFWVAHAVLSNAHGYIDFNGWRCLLSYMRPDMPQQVVHTLYDEATKLTFVGDGNDDAPRPMSMLTDGMNLRQFQTACGMLMSRMTQKKRIVSEAPIRSRAGGERQSDALEQMKYAGITRSFIYWLEVAADILVVVSIARLFFMAPGTSMTGAGMVLTYSLLAFFVFEMIVKISVYGVNDFFNRDWMNGVDLFVVLVSFVGTIVVGQLQEGTGTRADQIKGDQLNLLMCLRIIRLVRLVRILKRFSVVIETISGTIPLLGQIAVVLLLVFYSFAVLGTEFFGNLLRNSDANVVNSSYGRLGFWVFNFDHPATSSLTLFSILMTAKSGVIIEGTTAACQSNLPILYFVLFYIVVTMVLSNILFAFIMESYISRYNKVQERARSEIHGGASNQSQVLVERVNARLELEGCRAQKRQDGIRTSCCTVHKTSALGRLVELLSPELATSILYEVQAEFGEMDEDLANDNGESDLYWHLKARKNRFWDKFADTLGGELKRLVEAGRQADQETISRLRARVAELEDQLRANKMSSANRLKHAATAPPGKH